MERRQLARRRAAPRRGAGLAAATRTRQSDVYLAGVRGHRPLVPFDFAKLESTARRRMSREACAYVAGGAGLESTIDANRAAFERCRIVPRMLRDVSTRDTTGRPYVYGLALGGEAGVREVIRNFVADFDLTLGLAGCGSVSELGPECLESVP